MENNRGVRAIFEDMIRFRVKPKPSSLNQLPLAKNGNTLIDTIEDLEATNLLDLSQLNQFRTISSDRESQYRIYDEMCEDSIIASALEMYADDATQYNSKGQVIWAESPDNNISAFANRLIDILSLNKNAWSHIYSLVKYGDVYLETFRDDETDNDPLLLKRIGHDSTTLGVHKIGSIMEEYIEMANNPAELFDLTKHGKTVGFVKVETEGDNNPLGGTVYSFQSITKGQETTILPPDKYIHISLSSGTERFPETLQLSFNTSNINNSDKCVQDTSSIYTYNINRGKSMLHDLYKIYREINLMEDSLLLNRVTRSSIIRMLQVEVGDMPKSQARELLKRLKSMIEQKNYMDKNAGTYTSMAAPGPIDNVLYIPTHDGKGAVQMSNLGGDVDVKSITDIDYFKNKLYGGLKIPKQFLGDTDDPAGFSGGSSLTKLDARYARTVKRLQTAYVEGITTLINLFALSKGLDNYVNNFTIKMLSPSTAEDQERDETLDSRMSIINNFMDLIGGEDTTNPNTRKEMLLYFINNYLNEPELAEMLDADDTAKRATEEMLDGDHEDFEGDGYDSLGGGDFSPGSNHDLDDFDLDLGEDQDQDEELPEENPEIEFSEETPTDNSEEFGSFEQEF